MFRMIYSKVGYLSLQDSTEVYKLLNGKYVMIQWANPTEYAADILKFIPTSGFETVAILGSLVGSDMDEKFVFDADCEYGGVSSMRQLSTPIPKSYKGFVGFPPGTDELEDWEYWDDNYTRAYERWIQSVCAEFDAVVSLENISTVMQSAGLFQIAIGSQMFRVLKQDVVKQARGQVEPEFDETSGGETAETIRTPDEVIAIFGTKAQYDIGRTTLHHVVSRQSKTFETLTIDANFGVGFFETPESKARRIRRNRH